MTPSRPSKVHLLQQAVKTLACILLYYTFSIGITFYNKWMFSQFKFPIATTMVHFSMTFLLSGLARKITGCATGKKSVMLNWEVFLTKVLPTGIISALDIGLSNWSFMFITVSLYTMVKSSCILWILFFSLILGLEKPHKNLILIVICIAFGLFLFVFKSTQFNLEGFILVLLASFLGGARWTLSQVLCQKKELGLTNPIDTVYHLCPAMLLGLFPIFIGHETGFLVSKATFNADSTADFLTTFILIGSGGILAFGLSISEYLLLSISSSLTLSISGIAKELCTLIIATKVGSDVLTPTNWLGFLVCICGICIHVYNKYQKMQSLENGDSDMKDKLARKSSRLGYDQIDGQDELANDEYGLRMKQSNVNYNLEVADSSERHGLMHQNSENSEDSHVESSSNGVLKRRGSNTSKGSRRSSDDNLLDGVTMEKIDEGNLVDIDLN